MITGRMGEGELEIALRAIDEKRNEIITTMARGGYSSDNVLGGYREMTGRVMALDDAEAIVRDAFRSWLPPPGLEPKKREYTDY